MESYKEDIDAIVALLPQRRNFELSVLKLDGSVFDVSVGRNSTVAELKLAIEELFAALPGDRHGSISWSHVWGHFCLSYESQKLENDKVCIRNLGIKDGDQLQFIRHKSANQSPLKRALKHNRVPSNHYEQEEGIPLPEVKLAHFLRGWFGYSRLRPKSSPKIHRD